MNRNFSCRKSELAGHEKHCKLHSTENPLPAFARMGVAIPLYAYCASSYLRCENPSQLYKRLLLFYIRWFFFCSSFSSPLKPENFSLNRQSEKSRLLYSNRLLSTIWEPHKIDILEIMARGWTSMPRKKLVANRSARSAFTSEQRRRSVTFCENEGMKAADGLFFCRKPKNKPEQSELCSDMAEKGRLELPRRLPDLRP